MYNEALKPTQKGLYTTKTESGRITRGRTNYTVNKPTNYYCTIQSDCLVLHSINRCNVVDLRALTVPGAWPSLSVSDQYVPGTPGTGEQCKYTHNKQTGANRQRLMTSNAGVLEYYWRAERTGQNPVYTVQSRNLPALRQCFVCVLECVCACHLGKR
jgi:hypothetical protein